MRISDPPEHGFRPHLNTDFGHLNRLILLVRLHAIGSGIEWD
jgi:hypothetical protein